MSEKKRLEIGDKVKIVFGDGNIIWVDEMRKFIGRIETISAVSHKSEFPWFKIKGEFFHFNECDAERIEQ